MKVLIKPLEKEALHNTLIDALCSENDCNCTCVKNSNQGSNNSTTNIEDDILF